MIPKKKRIGILAFAEIHNGGIYQYTISLIDSLCLDDEYEYVIFTYEGSNCFDDYGLEVRKFPKSKNGVFRKITRFAQLHLGIRKPIFFSEREIQQYQDIDLFISPTISPYPHYYLNKPFIITLHDLQERYFPSFFSIKERLTRYCMNNALAKHSSRILCESNCVKKDIQKFLKIDPEKVSVIPAPPCRTFLDFKYDEEKAALIKNKHELTDNYLLYPAAFWHHKNHISLLEAFKIVLKKHEDLKLVLTGEKKNNYNNVMRSIDQLGLSDRVRVLGYVDYADLPYIYKMSQMLVMPTLFESVSIPIYEAFGLRVPVCSSNVVALPEQVGDAGLLFNPTNPSDMADKVMEMLSNQDLADNLTERGFKKIVDFDHQRYLQELLEVIHMPDQNCVKIEEDANDNA